MNYLNRFYQWLKPNRGSREVQALEKQVEQLSREQILAKMANANLKESLHNHTLELQNQVKDLEWNVNLYNPAIHQLKEQVETLDNYINELYAHLQEQVEDLENYINQLCNHRTASKTQIEELKDLLIKFEFLDS